MEANNDVVAFSLLDPPVAKQQRFRIAWPSNSILREASRLPIQSFRKWLGRNCFVKAYGNDELNQFMARVKLAAHVAMERRPIIEGPVAVSMIFVLPIRKTKIRKRGNPWTWKDTLPDVDNLYKPTADALKGIVWNDDGQVARVELEKVWSDQLDVSGVGIWVEPITEEKAASPMVDAIRPLLAEQQLLSRPPF